MAAAERRRYNIGVVKIPHADRDVAHSVISDVDDRGFFDIIGADTPDDDPSFPVGAHTTYRVELTDAEAEAFRQASNCRYVELDGGAHPHAGTVQFPSASAAAFMGAQFPEAGPRWHGRDVTLAVIDAGTTTAVRSFMGWTLVGREEFQDDPLGADGITIDHGCFVASCLVPAGGRILDAIVTNDDGVAPFSAAAAAFRWAADNGADIVNFSYGGAASSVLEDAVVYLQARGVQLFSSAGNAGLDQLDFPAGYSAEYDNVHSAIAFDSITGARAVFPDGASNYSVDGSGCGPGLWVLGLNPLAVPVMWYGTSAASPNMAQLCARLCTGGRFTPAQAGAALKANARDTGQPPAEQGGGAYDLGKALVALGGDEDGPTRTNLAINPSCQTNSTGWAGSGSAQRVTNLPAPFPRATGFQGTTDVTSPRFPVTAGQTYTSSAYARCVAATTVSVTIDWRNASGTVLSTSTPARTFTVQAGGVQRVFVTAVAPANATTGSMSVDPASSTTCAVAGHLVETGNVVGTYFDGASSNGAWLGTAGNSASTRAFPLPPMSSRRNLSTNPSVETNVVGYSAAVRAGLTFVAPATTNFIAPVSGALLAFSFFTGNGTTSSNPDAQIATPTVAVTAGGTYTFSIHALYSALGPDMQFQVAWKSAAGATLSTVVGDRNTLLTYEWARYWFTATAPAGAATAVVTLLLRGITFTDQTWFLWDALLAEPVGAIGDYFDGSFEGAFWDGAANASTSRYGPQPQSVAPAGVVSGEVVGSPLVAPAPLVVPASISSGEAFGIPELAAGRAVAPTSISSGEVFGTAVIETGLPIGPVPIGSAEAFGRPQISYPQFPEPVSIGSGEAFGSPTITREPAPGVRDLRIDFWAVDDDGTVLCPLPHVTSWDVSLVPGENGAVQIEYPRDGLHYDVLNERVTKKRDLRIRIRHDGTHAQSMGALLHARDGDEIAEGGTTRFIGAFLSILLSEAPLPLNQGSDDGSWTFTDGTAGSILADALNTVQGDGYLADTVWSFTDTLDSNGVAWSMETSAVFSPGKNILELVQQLRAWGMVEFEVVDSPSGGLEVRAYEPSTVGVDHTLPDPPIVFRVGRDLADAPHKADVSDAATSLLIAGDEGVYVEVDDPTAIEVRGRKVGRFLSEGNLTTAGAAEAYGILELSRSVEGVDELTHSLTFSQDQPVPIRELMPQDWVYSDTGSGLNRQRIAQVTISQASGDDRYSGGITLGDLIASRDLVVQRQLDGLVGGQIVTGTSTAGPETDDGKTPAQVQGVAVTSAAYPDQDHTSAAVTATWLAVTDNSDSSPASNIQQYEIQYRYAGGDEGLPTDWTSVAPQTDLDAAWDSVVAGVLIAVRVRAVNRYARAGEWSTEELHTTDADATPPPVPSTPTVSNYIGLIRVDWDGLGSAGEQQPADFDRVEILASEIADFDPATDAYTVIGMLRGEASYPWSPPGSLGNVDYDIEWFIKLRSVDKTGNTSAVSGQGSAIPGQVEEGDVASVNIGVLTAGIMNALMIVGNRIATGTTGSRVELDGAQGLFCINSAGETVFSYDIDDEILRIVGEVIAGAGVGSGQTITIEPNNGNPEINFYPQATQQRIRLRAVLSPPPDGGANEPGFWIETLDAAGNPDGPYLSASQNAYWLGYRDGSTYEGGNIKMYPSSMVNGVYVGADGGFLNVNRDGHFSVEGPSGNHLYLNPNTFDVQVHGDTFIRTAGDDMYLTSGGGSAQLRLFGSGDVTLIRNGSAIDLKNFIIDHPLDPDRWLIHACAEGPVAELLYSGEAVTRNGRAVVELPSYFEAASRIEGRQVQLTPVDELCMVAASRIEDGRFTIKCSGPDGTVVSWRAIAVRADVEQFPVEPLKSEIDVRGGGPYRYIAGQRTRD